MAFEAEASGRHSSWVAGVSLSPARLAGWRKCCACPPARPLVASPVNRLISPLKRPFQVGKQHPRLPPEAGARRPKGITRAHCGQRLCGLLIAADGSLLGHRRARCIFDRRAPAPEQWTMRPARRRRRRLVAAFPQLVRFLPTIVCAVSIAHRLPATGGRPAFCLHAAAVLNQQRRRAQLKLTRRRRRRPIIKTAQYRRSGRTGERKNK